MKGIKGPLEVNNQWFFVFEQLFVLFPQAVGNVVPLSSRFHSISTPRRNEIPLSAWFPVELRVKSRNSGMTFPLVHILAQIS